MDGRNWTGKFYNKSLTFGEGYVVTGGTFSSVQYGKTPTGNYWSGYSIGLGVGVSATGGTSKLGKGILNSLNVKNLKDIFTKTSFMPINVQNYYLLYGNGGEGAQEGWNMFYSLDNE